MADIKVKCGKCGAKVTPGYDFCLSCGTKFSDLPAKTKQRKGNGIVGKMVTKKYERLKISGIVLTVAGVVIFLSGILLLYSNFGIWWGYRLQIMFYCVLASIPLICIGGSLWRRSASYLRE